MSFAHILHAAHPVVDSLLCKSGTKIVVGSHIGAIQDGEKTYLKGEELGTDCSGMNRRHYTSLSTAISAGLVSAVSGTGRNTWPRISKAVGWEIGGCGNWCNDWGGTQYVRDKWVERTKPGLKVEEKHRTQRWWHSAVLKARTEWMKEHPGWYDEMRRKLEVDASSQVAGEMTDMNLDNKKPAMKQ